MLKSSSNHNKTKPTSKNNDVVKNKQHLQTVSKRALKNTKLPKQKLSPHSTSNHPLTNSSMTTTSLAPHRKMSTATPSPPSLPPRLDTRYPSVDNLITIQQDIFNKTKNAPEIDQNASKINKNDQKGSEIDPTDSNKSQIVSEPTPSCRPRAAKPARPLRVAFFGASDITGPVFGALHAATSLSHPLNHGKDYPLIESIDVITSPPVTRLLKGKKFTEKSPLAQYVEKHHPETSVEWYSADKSTPFRSHFEMARPPGYYDLAVVFSFPRLIPPRIIDVFPMGMINLHPSLIPLYRGPSPMQAALGNNDQETGVSVITIEPHKFDVGVVMAQRKIKLSSDTNLISLSDIVHDLGSETLLHVISNWDSVSHWSVGQDILMREFEETMDPVTGVKKLIQNGAIDENNNKNGKILQTINGEINTNNNENNTQNRSQSNPYVQKRLFAPKYGSTISPDFNTQSGDEIYGLWRGLVGFRQIHAKIAPKSRVDKEGKIVQKDPMGLIIAEMLYDRDPTVVDLGESAIAPEEGQQEQANSQQELGDTQSLQNPQQNSEQQPQQKRYQQRYNYFEFQPKEDIGSAIYDPHFNAIRIRCNGGTTALVSKFISPTGLPSDAKAIVNGFFSKENGKFFGTFFTNVVGDGKQ